MRRWLIGMACALSVAACSKPAPHYTVQEDSAAQVDVAKAPAAAAPLQRVGQPAPPPGLSIPQLAYAYDVTLETPSGSLARLIAGHEAACRNAGPARCQVIALSRTRTTGDDMRGELTVRAEPVWLQSFRSSLGPDAKAAGGRVVGEATRTEDLTRSIVDTDAMLRAKLLLADRLQQLLATRTGKLADLIEAEEALSKTQGEIDAARSELAVMRGRVATSELKITYESRTAFASESAWAPVGRAFSQGATIFAMSLAALITLCLAVLPFAVVGGIVLVAWRTWRRRRPARPSPNRNEASEG